MTEREFVYWLQGFAELNGAPPTAEQWQSIRDHLALVFMKVTPPAPPRVGWPYQQPAGAAAPQAELARAIC